MSTYAVRPRVRADQPLTQSQLDQLDDSRHAMTTGGKPRSLVLEVNLTMAGGDVVGALARSLNAVLDVVPGTVRHAEVTETKTRPAAHRRRR